MSILLHDEKCITRLFNETRAQNVKPHDDETKDSDDDSEFDAFAEELESN